MGPANSFRTRISARLLGAASAGVVLIGCAAVGSGPAGAQDGVYGDWSGGASGRSYASAGAEGAHQVIRGETAYSISRRYGVTPDQLRRANGLDDAYSIHAGQVLVIPKSGGFTPQSAPAAPQRDAFDAPFAPAGRAVGQEPRRMARPVDGRIVTPFGSGVGPARKEGVDIRARAGAPVFAADDGEVVFVSDGQSPVGSVLLIQHPGGVISVYGRIYAVQVKKGDYVVRGQRVARVAAPHSGGDAKLHFELRKDAKPIDPTPYI